LQASRTIITMNAAITTEAASTTIPAGWTGSQRNGLGRPGSGGGFVLRVRIGGGLLILPNTCKAAYRESTP